MKYILCCCMVRENYSVSAYCALAGILLSENIQFCTFYQAIRMFCDKLLKNYIIITIKLCLYVAPCSHYSMTKPVLRKGEVT